jgi:ketosteroid isomerase-like protein
MHSTLDSSTERSLLAAAQRLIEAFARHDTRAYFDAFAPEASFIFHTTGAVLHSRADYERLWQEWERDLGFHVLRCNSSDQTVQLLGEVGIFHHRVHTLLQTHDGQVGLEERETIVFARHADGHWLAVHEHLSPAPVIS